MGVRLSKRQVRLGKSATVKVALRLTFDTFTLTLLVVSIAVLFIYFFRRFIFEGNVIVN